MFPQQAKAEQEEEFISNTLLKKIQALKKEKESLAHHYEREEECLTNDLSRKLTQLRQEKCRLEQTLEQEQECLVNRLMRKIEKLEAETLAKQVNLEQLRREKVRVYKNIVICLKKMFGTLLNHVNFYKHLAIWIFFRNLKGFLLI